MGRVSIDSLCHTQCNRLRRAGLGHNMLSLYSPLLSAYIGSRIYRTRTIYREACTCIYR